MNRTGRRQVADMHREFAAARFAGVNPFPDRPIPVASPPAFWNDSGETVPAYGVMARTGIKDLGHGLVLPKIAKPSTGFCMRYLVNGDQPVPAASIGGCQAGDLVQALYDSGTPAMDEGWGPKSEQWTLTKNYPSTCLVDGIFDADKKILLGKWRLIDTLIGKLAGPLLQGNSATVNVWAGAGGSEAIVTSLTLSGRDWLMKSGATAIASGKKVLSQWVNGIWYITEAECP